MPTEIGPKTLLPYIAGQLAARQQGFAAPGDYPLAPFSGREDFDALPEHDRTEIWPRLVRDLDVEPSVPTFCDLVWLWQYAIATTLPGYIAHDNTLEFARWILTRHVDYNGMDYAEFAAAMFADTSLPAFLSAYESGVPAADIIAGGIR